MIVNNTELDLVNINPITKFGQILFICSRKEILTSIKGHDSVTNKQKMTGKNLNLDLVSINA